MEAAAAIPGEQDVMEVGVDEIENGPGEYPVEEVPDNALRGVGGGRSSVARRVGFAANLSRFITSSPVAFALREAEGTVMPKTASGYGSS
jgi:hypothetical protein